MTGAIIGTALGAGADTVGVESEKALDTSLEANEEIDTGEIAPKGIRGDVRNMLKSMAFGGPQSVMLPVRWVVPPSAWERLMHSRMAWGERPHPGRPVDHCGGLGRLGPGASPELF
jgi:hypothetical protein